MGKGHHSGMNMILNILHNHHHHHYYRDCCYYYYYYYYIYHLYAGYLQLYIWTNPVSVVYSIAAVLYLQRVLHVMLFHMLKCVLYFYITTFRSMRAVPNMDVFMVVPWFRTFPVSCWGIVWMILGWFQLPLL